MGQLECDDGNKQSGDGCSSECKIEEIYNCTGGNITSPDICTTTVNFTIDISFVESFDQILIYFNKEIRQFKTAAGTLAMISSATLSGLRFFMWNDIEKRREVFIKDVLLMSTHAVKVTLSNVGSTCGNKNLLFTAVNTSLSDMWNNTLNVSGTAFVFTKKCYVRMVRLTMFIGTVKAEADVIGIVSGIFLVSILIIVIFLGKGLSK